MDLTRVHAPVGLEVGGRTPEEIALPTLSEIVELHRRASGQPMRNSVVHEGVTSGSVQAAELRSEGISHDGLDLSGRFS